MVDTVDTDSEDDTDAPADDGRMVDFPDFLQPHDIKEEIVSDDDDVPSKTNLKDKDNDENEKAANDLLQKDLHPVKNIDTRVQVILLSDWLIICNTNL